MLVRSEETEDGKGNGQKMERASTPVSLPRSSIKGGRGGSAAQLPASAILSHPCLSEWVILAPKDRNRNKCVYSLSGRWVFETNPAQERANWALGEANLVGRNDCILHSAFMDGRIG